MSRNRTFPDMFRSSESQKSAKICKNPENPENREKIDFWALLGCLKGILRVQPESLFLSTFDRFRQVCGPCGKCSESSRKLSEMSEKSRKKIGKIFDLGAQIFGKIAQTAAGPVDRGWRHRALRGPKKIVNFWTFSRVKGKKPPNSALNRGFCD